MPEWAGALPPAAGPKDGASRDCGGPTESRSADTLFRARHGMGIRRGHRARGGTARATGGTCYLSEESSRRQHGMMQRVEAVGSGS